MFYRLHGHCQVAGVKKVGGWWGLQAETEELQVGARMRGGQEAGEGQELTWGRGHEAPGEPPALRRVCKVTVLVLAGPVLGGEGCGDGRHESKFQSKFQSSTGWMHSWLLC